MSWRLYRLVFGLRSPVHAGSLPVGNILRTRPYVAGKVFWGAATAGLVAGLKKPFSPESYREMGKTVKERLVFGYFFPRSERDAGVRVDGQDAEFRDRFEYAFLDTYASTAVNSNAGAAESNSLHEIEVIRCWTRPAAGERPAHVLLEGHLMARDEAPVRCSEQDVVVEGVSLLDCLSSIQIGGKRGYGFGKLELKEFKETDTVFGAAFCADGTVFLERGEPAAAHVQMTGGEEPEQGTPEVFVGREWREDLGFGAGQHLSRPQFCWAPGVRFRQPRRFRIGPFGIWEPA